MLCLTAAHLSLLIAISAQAPAEDAFTISGRVTMPDGSPAGSASVTVVANWPNVPVESPVSIRCDRNGQFHGLTSRFGFTTIIHAVSTGGSYQSELIVFDFMARRVAGKPFLIRLKPARNIRVTVTSEGKPVTDCEVVINRLPGSRSRTDRRGVTDVRFPQNCTSKSVVAFHPKHGIGAWLRKDEPNSVPATTEIQLAKPGPHRFRVLDQRDEPVANFDIKPAIRIEEHWAHTGSVPAAHIRTGETGTAEASWMPMNYRFIDATAASTRWQIDERSSTGNTTVLRVRKKHSFLGMVRFPDGKPRAGVLVVAVSVGPASSGDHAQARTNEKGVFQLHLAPDHAYVLGVRDQEWASDIRAGVMLRSKGDSVEYAKRGTILTARLATQVTVKVVNAHGNPMATAWVNIGLTHEVDWIDIMGKERHSTNSIRHWLLTDTKGVGSFGTLPGKLQIRATKHGWSREQEVVVNANEPLTVTIKKSQPGPAE